MKGRHISPDIYNALAHATADEKVIRTHKDAVRCLAFNPKDKSLISGAEDGEVLYWSGDIVSEPIKLKNKLKDGSIRSVAIASTGNWLAAGDYQGNLYLWESKNLQNTITRKVSNGMLGNLAFNPNSPFLFSGGNDSTIRSIDLQNLDQKPHVIGKMKPASLALLSAMMQHFWCVVQAKAVGGFTTSNQGVARLCIAVKFLLEELQHSIFLSTTRDWRLHQKRAKFTCTKCSNRQSNHCSSPVTRHQFQASTFIRLPCSWCLPLWMDQRSFGI